MATAPAPLSPGRQARRGPAPFASFDHDVSDESSPEAKLTFQLPEIREDHAASSSGGSAYGNDALAPPVQRERSSSTPGAVGVALAAAAPRIDISRASSSSHHDSRDSSPELALYAAEETTGEGESRARHELGFREDGALDLRSSTEELAFMEPAPPAPRSPAPRSPAPTAASERRHSRKDSQSSEAALLAISGRTSRLSSIGSQGSAHSAISNYSHVSEYSHVSRLSVISGISRSPSPHKMLLETSFCGPKPIENDAEICAGIAERRILNIKNVGEPESTASAVVSEEARCRVKTEATIENMSKQIYKKKAIPVTTETKSKNEISNQEIVKEQNIISLEIEQRKVRRKSDHKKREDRLEVYSSKNKSKDIIRIKLKPDDDDDEDDDDESQRTLVHQDSRQKPITLDLNDKSKKPAHFTEIILPDTNMLEIDIISTGKSKISRESSPKVSPTPSKKAGRKDHDSRTPSPAGINVSRKSSFCSLFKSRETITSPDSPSAAQHRRKKSVNEGGTRSRSKSRDRSTTPTSNNKIKGSVLSLFKTPKKGSSSLSPNSRDSSPVIQNANQKPLIQQHVEIPKNSEKLKYYEDSKNGVIHIPLHTPPDEKPGTSGSSKSKAIPKLLEPQTVKVTTHNEPITSTSALPSPPAKHTPQKTATTKPIQRTVLPDGSIIIPLHSPTEKNNEFNILNDEKPDILKNNEVLKPDTEENKHNDNESLKNNASNINNQHQQKKVKEHIVFSTKVGSVENVFKTQFSITKTPSIASEISESIPSLQDNVSDLHCELRYNETILKDTHITTIEPLESTKIIPTSHVEYQPAPLQSEDLRTRRAQMKKKDTHKSRSEPRDSDRGSTDTKESKSNEESHPDSSDSEPSSEVGPFNEGALRDLIAESIPAEEPEKKSLVVTQESFEEELPYVPTTLPLERSRAVPMLSVRARAEGNNGAGGVCSVRRPRSTTPRQPAALEDYLSDEARTPDTKSDKIKISLPRVSPSPAAVPPRRVPPPTPQLWEEFAERALPAPVRRPSSSPNPVSPPTTAATALATTSAPPAWINFEDVPERRKQPRRIQTVPREDDVMHYNYVEPDECRCECHHAPAPADTAPRDDELPLLQNSRQPPLHTSDSFMSDSSQDCSGSDPGGGGQVVVSLQLETPFTCDLDVRNSRDGYTDQEWNESHSHRLPH